MTTIKLVCGNCNITFDKDLREYRRQIKRGRKEFFCNHSCAATKSNKNKPRNGNINNLRANNRADEYTQFRWFVLRAEYRGRENSRYNCNLTVEYLKQLWEEQNGICIFTGWNLILPKNTKRAWVEHRPENASLDRIDNTKGYIQGNVRFIAYIANLARSTFSDEQLIKFCKSVAFQNNFGGSEGIRTLESY